MGHRTGERTPRRGSEAREDVRRLAAELTTVRRTGWALNLQESERGVHAVGACVRYRTGTAVAAVAVAAPSARCPKGRLNRLTSSLLLVARDIGQEL
ncbi:IclR family transcriptional regulator C-terminal domain-containing protein [Streptomyces sp. A244]|uniref:IclR family transcriptional regulator domain-containing protein n=1 Tax=Streptomyces sp. A244 TaxID=2137016 RepID=UPI0021597E5A|nr:IclR family transcriptional regulator C-terminal domain-containing protein [Streptomyces sp. A244]